MVISNGKVTKNLVLYPPVEPSPSEKPSFRRKPLPMEGLEPKNEELRPILTIGHALQFKIERKDETINTFISDLCSVSESTR